MKNLLKITLTLLLSIIMFVGIFSPELLMGTPASPAVGNWYQQYLPNIGSRQITDIIFLDSLTGYAVTSLPSLNDTAFILKTTNSGDSWVINHRDSGFIFKRIQFINQNTGFAGGTHFTMTTDAGINWQIISQFLFFDDMHVINFDTAWYVKSESLTGGVFFTSNGGTNWIRQLNLGSQNPEKIYMFNARIGFISTNTGSHSIWKTTNAGQNWNMNVNGQYFRDMVFADSLTGWYSYTGNAYKTTDGGGSWQAQALPFGGIIITSKIDRFSALSKDTLYGSGGEVFYGSGQFKGIIYRTINGGNSWQFQVPDTSLNLGIYSFVQFVNPRIGWAYHQGIKGIHTTNGGDTSWLLGIKHISTQIPNEYKLYQNYPNPFNPNTKIKYSVKRETSNVKLTVFDITGKHIIDLVNQKQNSGTYEVDFSGIGYSSGIYFYELFVKNGKEVFTDTKKMMLVK